MGRKSSRKQHTPGAGTTRSPSVMRRQWTLGHLIVAFVLGLVLGGGLIGYATGGDEATEPRGVTTDGYGRPPSDPHYGHAHP